MLYEEVHGKSFCNDTKDSFEEIMNSHVVFETTSSRPSVVGTGYDGLRGGPDDGGDDAERDFGQPQQSQHPSSPFTCEGDFRHCT